jgi:hypothetical protein
MIAHYRSPLSRSSRRVAYWAGLALVRLAFALSVVGLGVVEAKVAAAPPVNDECVNAIAISGNSVFEFDLTEATNSTVAPGCWSANLAMESDVWFKWRCTCAFARFTTCGMTDLDTVIEVYPAWTGCPLDADDALCCNDDAEPIGSCGFQSTTPECDTRCGLDYYVRIGVFPGTATGTGKLAITCDPPGTPCCVDYVDGCLPGSVLETEPYCTQLTPCQQLPLQVLECGQTVCGQFFKTATWTDIDQYAFTIDEPRRVRWTVNSDYAVDALIITPTCSEPVFLASASGSCFVVAEVDCLPPGEYWLVVGPAPTAPNIPCDQYNALYHATLECFACGECGDPDAGPCFAAHASAYCDDCDCCLAVCSTEPHCCQTEWDVACVKAAIEAEACAWPITCDPSEPSPRVFVCRAGCADDFALPPDPTQPANASCVPFDVISVDSCFSHTFQACWAADAACGACGSIVQAWLEIRYKVEPPTLTDPWDSILFGDQGNLIASTDVGPITPNTAVTKIIDLSAVPGQFGTTNILWSLADGELEIVCADDVTVDYATLTVIECPCSDFIEAGLERDQLCDGGASVSFGKPSTALANFLCPLPPGLGCLAFVSAYDYQVAGITVYDTFSAVPDCLSDATLLINAKFPEGTAGVIMHLELDKSCGTSFAWSMSINDLATLAGYLLPDYYCNGWTLIRLPLDALPTDLLGNTTSVLSQTLDNRVDYAIGPGAIVDWAFINYISCCPFSPVEEDLDGSGVVDGGDLGVLLSQWVLATASAATPILTSTVS